MKSHAHIWRVIIFLSLLTQPISYCLSQNKVLTIFPEYSPKNCKNCVELDKKTQQLEPDSIAFLLLDCIRKKGYLSASIDSFNSRNDSLYLNIFYGNQYTWKKIELVEDPLSLITQNHKKNSSQKNKPVSYNKSYSIKTKWINAYENAGYPFAKVICDSLEIEPDKISLTCKIEPGVMVHFDSLEITGTKKISVKYLQNYLGIFAGKSYNEKKVSSISKRLKDIPFLIEERPTEIYFIEQKAKVRFFLKDKKTNQFNGILGILPNKNKPGKFLLTGDVSLNLDNTFRHGDNINFSWKKLESSSQNLLISVEWPYLLNSPLGLDGSLKLFKKDSSFVNVSSHFGLPFYFIGTNNLGIYYERLSSTLLSTSNYSSATVLPSVSSFVSTMYGLSFNFISFDYKPNPKQGIAVKIQAAYGNKKIEKIPEINPVLYQNAVLSSFRNELYADASFYNPIYRNLVLKLRIQSAYLNSRNLLENELYRIGGLNSLRGFDEESLYASVYGIGTAEVRYLFEKNSAFFLFYDQARYIDIERIIDNPFGFGAGISFQTGSGIFTLSYALGRQQNNPIELRNARIHFGFINRF